MRGQGKGGIQKTDRDNGKVQRIAFEVRDRLDECLLDEAEMQAGPKAWLGLEDLFASWEPAFALLKLKYWHGPINVARNNLGI